MKHTENVRWWTHWYTLLLLAHGIATSVANEFYVNNCLYHDVQAAKSTKCIHKFMEHRNNVDLNRAHNDHETPCPSESRRAQWQGTKVGIVINIIFQTKQLSIAGSVQDDPSAQKETQRTDKNRSMGTKAAEHCWPHGSDQTSKQGIHQWANKLRCTTRTRKRTMLQSRQCQLWKWDLTGKHELWFRDLMKELPCARCHCLNECCWRKMSTLSAWTFWESSQFMTQFFQNSVFNKWKLLDSIRFVKHQDITKLLLGELRWDCYKKFGRVFAAVKDAAWW